MPPTLPPGTALDKAARDRVDALLALFRAAERQLSAIEADLRSGSYRKAYHRGRLREARAIIDRLLALRDGRATGEVVEWAREHFPETYRMGAGMAVRDLKAQAIVPVAGDPRIHTRAVEALLNRYLVDATEMVVQLNSNVIRASRIVLAQAGFGEEIATGIIGGLPRRETSRLLRDSLRKAVRGAAGEFEAGDLTHVEINGRRMRVDTWSEMHARTETARASTAGTRVLSSVNAVGHVQITTHSHEPCICTPFEGRIYSLAEGDDRFPWIGSVPGGGCPMHENCAHREAPAVSDFLAERGELEGRTQIPADFVGLDSRELARLVRANREQLAPYAKSSTGFLPENFRLREAA
ncbi:MAG: hypothetical protein KY464_17405 [Gemmatimonadetes bacterium]|nr:hypothetical protein [Gemmatimonadota bacterium]